MHANQSIPAVIAKGQGRRLNILGHSVVIKLQRKETKGYYYVMEVETPAGLGIPPHVHDREDELIYVIEGEFMIMLGDQNIKAGPGDEIFFPRNIPHAFQNIGQTRGRTLWTVAPGSNFEDFFEALGALPADREPDLSKVVQIFANYGMQVLLNPPV